MSDHGHHPAPEHGAPANDEDQRQDARGAIIVFACLVAMAIHFVSGWTF